MNALSDTKICNFYSSVMRQQASPEVNSTLFYLVGGGNSFKEKAGMPGN